MKPISLINPLRFTNAVVNAWNCGANYRNFAENQISNCVNHWFLAVLFQRWKMPTCNRLENVQSSNEALLKKLIELLEKLYGDFVKFGCCEENLFVFSIFQLSFSTFSIAAPPNSILLKQHFYLVEELFIIWLIFSLLSNENWNRHYFALIISDKGRPNLRAINEL